VRAGFVTRPLPLALLVVVAISMGGAGAQTEEESFAYIQSFDGGDTHRLILSNGPGTTQRVVTSQRAIGRPAFSPDGRRIAFPGPVGDDSDGRYGLYLVNMDGSHLQRLTEPEVADFDPAWSPDGAWLAFSRDRRGDLDPLTCCAIAIIRPDGTGFRLVPGTTGGSFPAWSPDGGRIAYQRPDGLWVTATDGSGSRQLAEGAVSHPAWSPDGDEIAYVSIVDDTRSQILVVPSDGGSPTVRVDLEAPLESPVWDPDGQTIYFVRYQGAGYDGRTSSAIWKSPAGAEPTRLFGNTHNLYFLAHTQHWEPAVVSPFVDVPAGHLFGVEIAWLAEEGITKGCNPPTNDRFCPSDFVTRGQMAAFLNRALGLPSTSQDFFRDDQASIFEEDINRLRAADITRGCADDEFCPDDFVTRGQMAAFLNRALGLPSTSQDFFRDDQASVFEEDINRLRAADITRGCNPPQNDAFCPDDAVTRGQMAAFLYRALR
jgi:Tol biopolymer transport system component